MTGDIAVIQQALNTLVEGVLGIQGVTPEDDFLRLGGNSILAFRLAMCIESTFNIDCPQALIFDTRSLAELASSIAALRNQPRA